MLYTFEKLTERKIYITEGSRRLRSIVQPREKAHGELPLAKGSSMKK